MELSRSFVLVPQSFLVLALILQLVCISFAVLLGSKDSRADRLLGYFFALNTLALLFYWISDATVVWDWYYIVDPLILNAHLWAIIAFSRFAIVAFSPQEDTPRSKGNQVQEILLLLFGAANGLSFMIFRLAIFENLVFFALILGTVNVLRILVCTGLENAKEELQGVSPSPLSVFPLLFRSTRRKTKMIVAYIKVVFLFLVFAVFALSYWTVFFQYMSSFTYCLILNGGLMVFLLLTILIYLSYSLEPTTLMTKLMLTTMALILSAFGAMSAVTMTGVSNALESRIEERIEGLAFILTGDDPVLAEEIAEEIAFIVRVKPKKDDAKARFPWARLHPTMRMHYESVYRSHESIHLENLIVVDERLANTRAFLAYTGRSPLDQYYVLFLEVRESTYLVGFSSQEWSTAINHAGVPLLFVFLLGFLLVLSVFPWYFRKSLIQPLDALMKGVERVSQGDLDTTVLVSTRDEVGLLAESFNQMVASVKQSERAVKAKSSFLANMSHEIRTPMNAVLGFQDLLAKTSLTKKQRDYVHTIGHAAKNLLGILNDILDTTKIESGKMSLERAPFSLDDVFLHVARLLGKSAYDKGIELLFAISPLIPDQVVGDSLRLSQVLLNLCSNAVKFTEKGEVLLSVELLQEELDHVILEFQVRDTGIGMSPKQMENLFAAFSQADESTTRRFGGTGLGLVIAKNLVELMGGEIQVVSEAGVGSCFSFSLSFPVKEGKKGSWQKGVDGAKRRVFVLERHKTTAQVLKRVLRHLLFEPSLVSSWEEVQEEATEDCALFILEYQQVSHIDPWKPPFSLNVPILFTVTPKEEEMCQEALCGGSVVTKPLLRKSLVEEISSLLWGEGKSKEEDLPKEREGSFAARILVVEDHPVNQELARELLMQWGITVELAENGAVALEKVRTTAYDLVFMDIQMPVMDGLTACQEIRLDPLIPKELPIIALSADVIEATQQKVFAVGMNGLIPKPLEPKVLLAALRKWIPRCEQKELLYPRRLEEEGMKARMQKMLPSFDVPQALLRVGGNLRLYQTVLTRFSEQDYVEVLKETLKEEDSQGLVFLLHNLKGVAMNLGLNELASRAKDMEVAIAKEDRAVLGPLIEGLFTALKRAKQELQPFLLEVAEKEDTTARDISKEELVYHFDRFEEALKGYNTEADGIFSILLPYLRQKEARGSEAVQRALKEYDFEEALRVFSGFREKIG